MTQLYVYRENTIWEIEPATKGCQTTELTLRLILKELHNAKETTTDRTDKYNPHFQFSMLSCETRLPNLPLVFRAEGDHNTFQPCTISIT